MPMPPDVESYLRSLARRFNEPDLREVANEIKRLTAELKQYQRKALDLKFDNIEKGGRIESLEQSAAEGCLSVSYDALDAAWKFITDQEEYSWDTAVQCLEDVLEPLGIERCEECGGSGETLERENNAVYRVQCPSCHGHGWVKK